MANKGSTFVHHRFALRLLQPQIPHIAYQVHRDDTNLFYVAVWSALLLEVEHEWEFQINLNCPQCFQSQCTSPKHPVSCIKHGLASHFIYDIIHVSMSFSQIIPPSPSPTESTRLFYTSVSLLPSHIQGYCYHLSKFHIYALVYCIGVFLSGLLHSV